MRKDLTQDDAGNDFYLPRVEDAINDEAVRLGISFFKASGIYEDRGIDYLRALEPEDLK